MKRRGNDEIDRGEKWESGEGQGREIEDSKRKWGQKS